MIVLVTSEGRGRGRGREGNGKGMGMEWEWNGKEFWNHRERLILMEGGNTMLDALESTRHTIIWGSPYLAANFSSSPLKCLILRPHFSNSLT